MPHGYFPTGTHAAKRDFVVLLNYLLISMHGISYYFLLYNGCLLMGTTMSQSSLRLYASWSSQYKSAFLYRRVTGKPARLVWI